MPPEATAQTRVMLSLADFTRRALIVPQLRERDTAGIISELSQILQRQGCVPDVLPFYQAALTQELLANSALECGIALPHARLSGVKRVEFALGRTREPVIWGGKNSLPVQVIFLLAVPATDAIGYLQLRASLAKLCGQPELLANLRFAEGTTALWGALERIQLRGDR